MRVRALKGFTHRVTGTVAEGAVLDVESRGLAEALIADGYLTATTKPAEVIVTADAVEPVPATRGRKGK